MCDKIDTGAANDVLIMYNHCNSSSNTLQRRACEKRLVVQCWIIEHRKRRRREREREREREESEIDKDASEGRKQGHTDERPPVHSTQSFLVVNHPSTNRGRRALASVNVPLS